MTMITWPDHLLTPAEWAALPADRQHRYELMEGVVLAPRSGSADPRWLEFDPGDRREIPVPVRSAPTAM